VHGVPRFGHQRQPRLHGSQLLLNSRGLCDTTKYFQKAQNLIQTPERFIEDHLVFPMLRQAFGYSLRPQPKQYAPRWPRRSGIPDFAITSIPIEEAMQHDIRFFGEVKPQRKSTTHGMTWRTILTATSTSTQ